MAAVVTFRTHPEHARLIDLAADMADLSRSEWLRAAVAAALRLELTSPPPEADPAGRSAARG